jgi:hypothetical protein
LTGTALTAVIAVSAVVGFVLLVALITLFYNKVSTIFFEKEGNEALFRREADGEWERRLSQKLNNTPPSS